jgi:nicotinamide phosphoribosyltransferase
MEHSTVFTWDNEDDAYENALIQYLGVGKTVACVLDTNDFDAALERFAVKFKDRIAASGGRVVIRHDSGSPIYNSIKAIERMMELFGYTVNKKGFRVLPDYIRFIWGDGTDPQIIDDVLYALVGMGIAAENIVFGEGAGLLQKVCRDDIGFSFKLNEKAEEAVRTAVCKRPVTGLWKASKAGRLALIVEDWKYKTIPEAELNGRDNILRTVFKDGKLLIDENFSVIRERANENFEMEI